MKPLLRILQSLLAVIVGYALMVVLITLVQEGLFGGVSYYESSTIVLVIAGLLTVLCAVVGGFTAAWIARRAYLLHAGVMSIFVVVETTVLITTGRVGGPLWFDVVAAGSLIAGLLGGAALFNYLVAPGDKTERNAA